MTDPTSRVQADPMATSDPAVYDPDKHSTWNTIDGAVDVDDVLDEDDLENFLVEPMPEPFDPLAVPESPVESR